MANHRVSAPGSTSGWVLVYVHMELRKFVDAEGKTCSDEEIQCSSMCVHLKTSPRR